MIRPILSTAALSFVLVSGAWALPVAPKPELPAVNQSEIIQVGKKGHGHYHGGRHYNRHYHGGRHYNRHYHGGKHWRGRYYHGGRYWGHRYYHRPWNWRALGCVVVGPVWYCP